MRGDSHKQTEPGLGERLRLALLSWPFLLALAVLLFNDHYLKSAWPGFVSGKLSDLAGIFGVALVCFAARAERPWLTSTILFALFLCWKSPASQLFIDAVISLGWSRIGRTVDYTDLGAFVLLPLAWCAAQRLGHVQLFSARVRRIMMAPMLVVSALAVAATSEPIPDTAIDAWIMRPVAGAPALRWSEVSAAVDAAAELHDMKTRNWRPNAERVRYTRPLISLDYEFSADGAVKVTIIGESDTSFFFPDNVEKIMAALKEDVKREFSWRFGKLEYIEIPMKCSCGTPWCTRSQCVPVAR